MEDVHLVLQDYLLGIPTVSKADTLCLLLDASSNISTSCANSTPSTLEVILWIMRYINYFTYLLTSLLKVDRCYEIYK